MRALALIFFSIPIRSKTGLVLVTPTAVQMLPQTRHYMDRSQIFKKFKDNFKSVAEFTELISIGSWESLGVKNIPRFGTCRGHFLKPTPTSSKMP